MLIKTAEPHRTLERLAARRDWRRRHAPSGATAVTLVAPELVRIEALPPGAGSLEWHPGWIAPIGAHRYGAARLDPQQYRRTGTEA